MKNKKFMIILIIAFANLSFLAAQTESEPSDHFVLTYNLGAEYSYSLDFGLYDSIPFYNIWQKQMTDISPKMIDPLGGKGHVFRVVNQFEWRKNKLSFSAFANLTLNYLPAFIDTSLLWFPSCMKAAFSCFKGALNVWAWALKDGWLLVNACTLFIIPIFASSMLGLSGVICLVAAPLSVAVLAIPMASIGGSIDYHPYSNDVFDSKLSLGIDVDGYRAMVHAGLLGLFAQAEAAAFINNIRLYAQAGYRLDVANITNTIKTKQGTIKPGYEGKYVPAPYVKAGITWCFGREK